MTDDARMEALKIQHKKDMDKTIQKYEFLLNVEKEDKRMMERDLRQKISELRGKLQELKGGVVHRDALSSAGSFLNPYMVTRLVTRGLGTNELAMFDKFEVVYRDHLPHRNLSRTQKGILTNKENVELQFWKDKNGEWECAVNDSGLCALENFEFFPDQNENVDVTWDVKDIYTNPVYDIIKIRSDVAEKFQAWVEAEHAKAE